MKTIIPEVMNKETVRNDNNNNYNIHLSKTENNQTYNKIDNSTNITNTQSKGFFRFVFDIITFPIVLIYKMLKYPLIRYEVKNNYSKYKLLYEKRKATKQMLKKIEKMQGFNDEIF